MKSFVILALVLSSVAFADQTVPASQTQVQQTQESANPSAKKAKKHKKVKKAAKPAAQAPATTTQQ